MAACPRQVSVSARDVCRVVAQAPDVGLPADDARADGLGLVGQVSTMSWAR